MTTIKAPCPQHGTVQITHEDMVVVFDTFNNSGKYEFTCPEGQHLVVKEASRRIVELLVSENVAVVRCGSDIGEDTAAHAKIIADHGPTIADHGPMTPDDVIDTYLDIQEIDVPSLFVYDALHRVAQEHQVSGNNIQPELVETGFQPTLPFDSTDIS